MSVPLGYGHARRMVPDPGKESTRGHLAGPHRVPEPLPQRELSLAAGGQKGRSERFRV